MAGSKYQSFDPAAEVNGRSMLAFIECLRQEEILPFLEAHGLTDIDPEGWYPIQQWLDVLSDLAQERPGQAMFDFVAVGMKIPEVSKFPPEFEQMSFWKLMSVASGEYSTGQHRGNAGEILFESLGPKHITYKVRTPYPDDFWYGICYGFCRRYLPPGTRFTVHYDEKAPRREQGGEYTVIHMTWE